MIDIVTEAFYATITQLTTLIIPIIAIYLVMHLIAELILGKSRA